jgi:small subunit ribosomal protein S27Ae
VSLLPGEEKVQELPSDKKVREEKKEKKVEEGKKKKSLKKHKKIQIWKKYNVQGNKVTRVGESCPRCGVGVFLANHGDRITCGKCGFSEIKSKE